MEDLLERLRKSEIIHDHKVPPKIQGSDTGTDGDRATRVTGVGRSGNPPGGDILGPGAARSPGGASAGKKTSAECAKILKKPLAEAEKAVTESGKQWSLDCIFQGNMAEAFGFMTQLLPPDQKPCFGQYLVGQCKTRSCPLAHRLTRKATREQLKAFTGWVQSRCQEIWEDPSKA